MDEFCSWTACLHGSVQILLQWCLGGSEQSLHHSRHLIPGHNRAIGAKSCTVRVLFTRVRTKYGTVPVTKLTCFFRSQTWLNRSKIRPVPPVSCERKVEPCKFLSAQRFVQTRVNGALAVQKFVQFHTSRVNGRWNRASFLSLQKYVPTRVNGASVSQETVRSPLFGLLKPLASQ